MSEEEDEINDFKRRTYNTERAEYMKTSLKQKSRLLDRFLGELRKVSATIENEKQIIEKLDDFTEKQGIKKDKTQCKRPDSAVSRCSRMTDQTIKSIDISLADRLPPLYRTCTTEDVIAALNPNIDFEVFFRDYPLVLIALFDENSVQINFREIFEFVERWDINGRTKFATHFFKHLEHAATLVGIMATIPENPSVVSLGEFVESHLPKILNTKRAVFMLVENDELILEKQRLKFASKLLGGTVTRSIKMQEQLVLTHLSLEEETEDVALMRMNASMLVTPIDTHPHKQKDKVTENRKNEKSRHNKRLAPGKLTFSSKKTAKPLFIDSTKDMDATLSSCPDSDDVNIGAVLLLFDCSGGFHSSDLLIAKEIGRVIGESLPIIMLKKKYHYSRDMLQDTLDVLMDVAATNDLNELLKSTKKAIPRYFQCEDVNLFKVLPDGRFYAFSKPEEIFPQRTGLVGEAIYSKRTLLSADPELSVHYNLRVDSKDKKSQTRSILICPIFASNGLPSYAIVLYNKIHIDSFSQTEVMTLEMFCQNTHNIFESASNTQLLTGLAKSAKDMFDVHNSICMFFQGLPQLSNIETLSVSLSKVVQSTLNKQISVYIADHNQQAIVSYDPTNLFHASFSEAQNPVVTVFKGGKPMESYSSNEVDNTYLFPLKSGIISIKNQVQVIGISKSGWSISDLNSLQTSSLLTKSTLELKLEKLDSVQEAKLREISDTQVVLTIEPWAKVMSPLISIALLAAEDIKSLTIHSFSTTSLPLDEKVCNTIMKDICADQELEFTAFVQPERSEIIHSMIEECTFPPQEQSSKFVYPKSIPLFSNYDVFSLKMDNIELEVITIIKSCGLDDFIDNNIVFACFLDHVKKAHKPNVFSNFLLCIDHVQFAAMIIKMLDKKEIKHFAVILTILGMYCDIAPETVVFAAESMCTGCPFRCDREELYKWIGIYSRDFSFGVLFEQDVCQLICAICRYSYMIRPLDLVKKFLELRFKEEGEENVDVQNFTLETEVRAFIVPCCGEFMKREIRSDTFRKLFTSNASGITHASF